MITSISEKIGGLNALLLDNPSPILRKQNKIKTIHNSLKIEGNTLSEIQITALIDNTPVLGPEKDILEVLNAIKVYNALDDYQAYNESSFLKAHKTLMQGLVEMPGKYRTKGVGIIKGDVVKHLAPPPENVPFLMQALFMYLKSDDELPLIKSCIFHYEMEFIHPFLDGNGRMGRLWQTLILKKQYPIFTSLPFETLISETQTEYYQALAASDKAGKSTPFIAYMLEVINASLAEKLTRANRTMNQEDRLQYFVAQSPNEFSRKDYMKVFKDLSTASASRDLKKGLALNLFTKKGDKRLTNYHLR